MADLSVEVAGIRFSNPILPAAGPPGRGGRAFLFEGFLREVGEPASERVLPPPLEAPVTRG